LVSDWSAWGSCNNPCGAGTQTRTRTVTQQGQNCPALTESQACTGNTGCPCQAGPWSEWSACSEQICGFGTQTRTRNISYWGNGLNCPPLTESQSCYTAAGCGCYSDSDCAAGQYCETSYYDNGGGYGQCAVRQVAVARDPATIGGGGGGGGGRGNRG
jgi:hypothetical protein